MLDNAHSIQSVLPSQQHALSHTQHSELHCQAEQDWTCIQQIVCRLLPDAFLRYAHLLLATRGAGSHDAQGCWHRLHATSCLGNAEPDLMVPPVKVCAMFSALLGAE